MTGFKREVFESRLKMHRDGGMPQRDLHRVLMSCLLHRTDRIDLVANPVEPARFRPSNDQRRE